ncbi:MAG: dihydroneopterin aldolase [Bacteroidales bacterium]|nr:dihydroneopterin aldolase [Bacteroidales bacterium]
MAQIILSGMEFYAYHGCFSEEQIIGNKFLVDFSFDYETNIVEKTDNLNDAIDYQSVYNVINAEMQKKSKLLEHIGRRIIIAVKSKYPSVKNIVIKISKCNPPIGGKMDLVSVVLKDDTL